MSEALSASAAVSLWTAVIGASRSVLVATLAAGLIGLARPSASARHVIWAVTLGVCLVLSLAPSVWTFTSWSVPLAMPVWIEGRVAGAVGVGLAGGPFVSGWNLMTTTWAVAAFALLIRLFADLRSVRGLVRRSTPLAPGLVMSEELRVPALWGIWRPVIILPPDARSWPAVERRTILDHERAHARRRDPLVFLLTRAVCALCWFNPVCWWIARRMELARECACDDAVLNAGADRLAYARQLVDIGARIAPEAASRATICLTPRTASLKRRVRRLLAADVRRGAMRRTALGVSGVLLAATAFGLVIVPDTTRLHFLPVRNGTLVVEGRTRLLVRDMWPTSFPPGDAGRVTVRLHTIRSLRAARARGAPPPPASRRR